VQLPAEPVNSGVLRYDVLHSKLECQIVPERDSEYHGQPVYLQHAHGWEVDDWPPCVHVTDMQSASALLKVHLKSGHVSVMRHVSCNSICVVLLLYVRVVHFELPQCKACYCP
jgi:hypothetical protein